MQKTGTLIVELENLAKEHVDTARGTDAVKLTLALLKAHEKELAELEKRLQAVERSIRDTE